MKHLVVIVHASAQQDLADHLRRLEAVQDFTFSAAEGHGSQAEHDPLLSARDRVVGYVPRVRVDLLVDDADVKTVISALRAPNVLSGHGIYWVTAVEQSGRL